MEQRQEMASSRALFAPRRAGMKVKNEPMRRKGIRFPFIWVSRQYTSCDPAESVVRMRDIGTRVQDWGPGHF